MTTWTRDELSQVGAAEELEIAPLRREGLTRPTVVSCRRTARGLATELNIAAFTQLG